jgi:hypothetical protein
MLRETYAVMEKEVKAGRRAAQPLEHSRFGAG